MGLIKAAKDAISTLMADQWREYFYCDALPDDVLVVKGQKKVNSGRNSNTKGLDNIITNGSIVTVNAGQCMIVVDDGAIVEVCAEPGNFVYDVSTEPSLFYGSLGDNLKQSFSVIGKRFTFGGNQAKDQRVYYFNILEIKSNLFGTPNPIPFRAVDNNIGMDLEISIRCNGEYSFRIADPLIFYKNVCGNITDSFQRSELQSIMKAELLTALQPALGKISSMGIRYSEVVNHTMELTDFLNEELSEKWGQLRGIEIVSMNINSLIAPPEDAAMIKEMQMKAAHGNIRVATGTLVEAQAEAMKSAAKNEATGPMFAFAGMNMANMMGGMNAGQMMQQSMMAQGQQMNPNGAGMMNGQQVNAQQAGVFNGQQTAAEQTVGVQAPVLGWVCSCGHEDNRGKFCAECGSPKPAEAGWTCSCGTVNQGKFCVECGAKKPQGAPLYRCDKCGWEPEDPAQPPKFCPECGDIFDESDKKQ